MEELVDMPLRSFKCKVCGVVYKTKHGPDPHCGGEPVEEIITAPSTQFLEKTDPERGKSALVGQEKILRERARTHSREHETDDLIQMNSDTTAPLQNGWLKADGSKRKAIDDK